MSYYLSPISPFLQVFTDAGIPLGGALLWTYLAGTTTPGPTYTDITGGTPNSNPIQMASNGRLPSVEVWQPGGVAMKYVFSTNAGTTGSPVFGVQIGPTLDRVSGINDPAASLSVLSNPATTSGPFGSFLVANSVTSFDTITDVRLSFTPVLAAAQTLVITVEGGASVGDGLGGVFYWNATSGATDDGITVIKLAGAATGRYLRFIPTYSGSFTGTFTGLTPVTTNTVQYTIEGKMAMLTIESGSSNTSNATTFTMTGLPAILQPATRSPVVPIAYGAVEDNGASAFNGAAQFAAGSGTIAFLKNGSGTWTNTGTKGFTAGIDVTLVYPLT